MRNIFLKNKGSKTLMVAKGLICLTMMFSVLGAVAQHTNHESLSPKQIHQEEIKKQFNPWDGSHIKLTRQIKKYSNDPSSFQHIETRFADHDEYLIVETDYRAKNRFGALVRGSVRAQVNMNGDIVKILKAK